MSIHKTIQKLPKTENSNYLKFINKEERARGKLAMEFREKMKQSRSSTKLNKNSSLSFHDREITPIGKE